MYVCIYYLCILSIYVCVAPVRKNGFCRALEFKIIINQSINQSINRIEFLRVSDPQAITHVHTQVVGMPAGTQKLQHQLMPL